MLKNEPILYRILRGPLTFLIKSLYRLEVVNSNNIPECGRVIIASNHKSNLDAISVVAVTKRTVIFMAKDNLHKGIIKPLFKSLGTIPVNRREKDPECRNRAVEVLNEDKVLGIFPEGTRNKTNDITMPFKYGAVSFASKTNSLIIPCAITGKYRLFRKGLKITLGKPIDIRNMELPIANKLLEDTIRDMIITGEK